LGVYLNQLLHLASRVTDRDSQHLLKALSILSAGISVYGWRTTLRQGERR